MTDWLKFYLKWERIAIIAGCIFVWVVIALHVWGVIP